MTTVSIFPSLPDIEGRLAEPDVAGMEPLRLAVLRNITVEPIEPYLRYLACRQRLNASVVFGGFDNLVVEALGGAPELLHGDLDAVLVFAPLAALSPEIFSNFAALDAERLQHEVERIKSLFETVAGGIRRQTDATILWHGLEPPLFPVLGIRDAQMENGQAAMVAALNAALRATLNTLPGAYLVDMAGCLARTGGRHFYDTRYWHLARAPYTRQALAEIAAEDFKFMRALKGRAKKCLVLDCDNTLWGGIIGEDGLSGIKLGRTYPGSAFLEFQQEVVSLFHRGIIIVLCSKNNEDDVWEVFDRHPDMVLRREHVTAWRINWRDKAANIRELAEELNIGVDSMVLADDSEFEANLVRDQLPEVEIIQLSKGQPVDYRHRLAACGLFDVVMITDEDRMRGAMYASETVRRRAKSEASDIEGYYRSLEMRLEIGYGDEFSTPRVAQLTQKTNQFNLTARRYGEADISRFVKSPEHDAVWIRVSDRFGDLGIVGTCILTYAGRRAYIDTLLLSCRALGRGVEKKFLAEILHLARLKEASSVQGEYLRTQKNEQAERFFLENGFSEIEAERTLDRRVFECRLEALPPRGRGYFAEIISPLGVMDSGSRQESLAEVAKGHRINQFGERT